MKSCCGYMPWSKNNLAVFNFILQASVCKDDPFIQMEHLKCKKGVDIFACSEWEGCSDKSFPLQSLRRPFGHGVVPTFQKDAGQTHTCFERLLRLYATEHGRAYRFQNRKFTGHGLPSKLTWLAGSLL